TRRRNEDVSETVTTSNNRDNVSNVNNADGNSGHNTNDVGGNLDREKVPLLCNNAPLSNLANTTSTPNISASRTDSDISMVDVGGSQPLEPINE
ncbi:15810_t:CDS:1, partial [Gigaspora margarita]